MTNEQKLEVLARRLVNLYRDRLRTQARLDALRDMVRLNVPDQERAAWDGRLKKLTDQHLQKLLQAYEPKESGFAAWLDDRKGDELHDLE